MKAVSGISGIQLNFKFSLASLLSMLKQTEGQLLKSYLKYCCRSMNMKDKKLTLTGDIDPVQVFAKLRKFCHTEIVSVGAAKEEKKEEPKKDDKMKEDEKKDSTLKFYQTYGYYYQIKPQYNPYYTAISVQEDPNACVIV
ncbi:heavy metal-associated isoprenylated plant protein 12-like [Vigna radiata var. radiata]|uniref:Heavy metal-associated isoprenylated plant protein 12-like n=1 Tax=Vigna radiata var. radiata TaxID=3916 RepID=A0A3Q0FAX4_VIGRR|nr:heavy metal-associated isoprenylated plant protein 12-like [Vigna radiata var. radiata]